jgi:hypothetical protein
VPRTVRIPAFVFACRPTLPRTLQRTNPVRPCQRSLLPPAQITFLFLKAICRRMTRRHRMPDETLLGNV